MGINRFKVLQVITLPLVIVGLIVLFAGALIIAPAHLIYRKHGLDLFTEIKRSIRRTVKRKKARKKGSFKGDNKRRLINGNK